mmetsp:Transcript_120459/g.169445  ORF Transcript_120459/g.169445 Transcript_120459/m.169445 type:complete len:94 (-) Transcript_120459:8-289(-)
MECDGEGKESCVRASHGHGVEVTCGEVGNDHGVVESGSGSYAEEVSAFFQHLSHGCLACESGSAKAERSAWPGSCTFGSAVARGVSGPESTTP